MRVCLFGDYSDRPDEGYRNVITSLTREISSVHEVRTINMQPPERDNFFTETKKFKPDIIHYLSAPTLSSLLITCLAKRLATSGARTVVSCLHPNGLDTFANPLSRAIAPFLKPDMMLTQDEELDNILRMRHFRTQGLPNGVDLDKFKPATPSERMDLREKYGVDRDRTVILHVGHIVPNRGLGALSRIMRDHNNVQVIVVGSAYSTADRTIIAELEDSGCLVWMRHFDHIEEVFQLSDIYIFPVQKRGSVSMPLSILEAMACEVPVITTQFNSLRRWFGYPQGLYYVKDEEIGKAVDLAISAPRPSIRLLLKDMSWHDVGRRLMAMYDELREEGLEKG